MGLCKECLDMARPNHPVYVVSKEECAACKKGGHKKCPTCGKVGLADYFKENEDE